MNARNIRNIVLMRPVNTMIEFKQIIGRGTRLFDGKDYFTIYDFVKAYEHFSDPEWDGDPLQPEPCPRCGNSPCSSKRIHQNHARFAASCRVCANAFLTHVQYAVKILYLREEDQGKSKTG